MAACVMSAFPLAGRRAVRGGVDARDSACEVHLIDDLVEGAAEGGGDAAPSNYHTNGCAHCCSVARDDETLQNNNFTFLFMCVLPMSPNI